MLSEPLPIVEPIFVNRSHLDIVEHMIITQGSFVCKRLPLSERPVFLATMEALLNQCRLCVDVDHFGKALCEIRSKVLQPTHPLIRLFFNPLPTKTLAFYIVEEIVFSVKVRFIDGGSKTFILLLKDRYKVT